MQIREFILFFAITFIISASPGPSMLTCMTQSVRYGLKKTYAGITGASSGNIILVIVSLLGVGLLIKQNTALMNGIKWFGAAYLVFLGVQFLRSPLNLTDSDTNAKKKVSSLSLFFSSFLIALSNPKGLLYFVALFPQFVTYDQSLGMRLFILISVFLITDIAWMIAYAHAGNAIVNWLKSPRHQLMFHYFSGATLILAGCAMGVSGINA